DALRDRRRNPAARLLDDDRHAELFRDARDRLEAAAKIAVAARLHELHRRIEVDAQRVGADLVDHGLELRRLHLASLDHAHVAEDDRAFGDLTHAEGAARLGPNDHRALAAEPERVAALLGDRREIRPREPG